MELVKPMLRYLYKIGSLLRVFCGFGRLYPLSRISDLHLHTGFCGGIINIPSYVQNTFRRGGQISAGYDREITSASAETYSVGSSWEEHSLEFTIGKNDLDGYVAFSVSPNTTPYITQFDVRDFKLEKIS
jgi:hypothetical protein